MITDTLHHPRLHRHLKLASELMLVAEPKLKMAKRQPSIASLYHTATKQAGLNDCDGLHLWLQSAIDTLCRQERGIAGLLADRAVLEECMAVSVAAPLPAGLLTLSPTANILDTVKPAAKPLAILLHLLISKMLSATPSSTLPSSSVTAAAPATAPSDQCICKTAAGDLPDGTDSLLCSLDLKQPKAHDSDAEKSPQLRKADQLLTVTQSALLVLKVASIAEASQPAQGRSNNVTRVLWAVTRHLVTSIPRHFKACLADTQHAQPDSHDNSQVDLLSMSAAPLDAVKAACQLLVQLLLKAASLLVQASKPTDAQRVQICFEMLHLLLSSDAKLFDDPLMASKLISWGKFASRRASKHATASLIAIAMATFNCQPPSLVCFGPSVCP